MAEEAFKLDPEMFAQWWTPLEALAYAAKCVGPNGAHKALWQLLVGGMITAIASSSSETTGSYPPETTTEPRFIPQSQWKDFTESESDLWTGAYARFWNNRGQRPVVNMAFGIKFNPNNVRPHLPLPHPVHEAELAAMQTKPRANTAEPAKPPAGTANKGGAPRKDWWDDFWIAICGEIYEGNLKPNRQADLEKAMLNWATNHGHDMSEATARKVAKKLFIAWKLGG